MMEVRCCCQPQKLLGWIDVPPDVHVGQVMRFSIATAYSCRLNDPVTIQREEVELPVAWLSDIDGVRLALKSEETPIEVLRRIRGFREAPTR